MFDATSPLWGILILAVAITAAIVVIRTRNNRIYEAQMAKYREALSAMQVPESSGAPAKEAAPAVVSVSSGEVALTGVDETAAAMIIAILCDTIGGNPAELKIKAISAL